MVLDDVQLSTVRCPLYTFSVLSVPGSFQVSHTHTILIVIITMCSIRKILVIVQGNNGEARP
jgi:hypothetical protein